MPGIEIRQQLRLAQTLVMTPQLQLAIKLLQLSRLEMEDHVRQELVENPVLEEIPEGPEPEKDAGQDAKAKQDGQDSETLLGGEAATDWSGRVQEILPDAPAGEMSDSKVAEVDLDRYLENHSVAEPPRHLRTDRVEEYPKDHDERYATRGTLYDHLAWQVQMGEFTDDERRLAMLILGNLDRDGYFREPPLEDLAAEVGIDLEDAEALLATIQEMDPVGIAARDLRECLLAQARVLRLEPPIVAMIDKHLGDIERRNFPIIAKSVELDLEDVYAAAQIVATLEPRPARNFVGDDPYYVVPDVEVRRGADDWEVISNDDGMPRLRISRYYRELAHRDPETRQYIRDKVRSAQWLIRSIQQRQNTLLRVTRRIVERQRDFFEHGVAHLKPMILKDIAEDLGMHESTIGRVTTNKFVQTPHGIFELKYFFHSRIRRLDDEDIASEAVRRQIKEIIDGEDTDAPYSDQQIMKLLAGKGIIIARRTVAKYREAMGILSSSRRRKFY